MCLFYAQPSSYIYVDFKYYKKIRQTTQSLTNSVITPPHSLSLSKKMQMKLHNTNPCLSEEISESSSDNLRADFNMFHSQVRY